MAARRSRPLTRRALGVALLASALWACGPSLAARYAAGNRNLSTPEGAVYFVVLSPVLQRALNTCIPPGTPGASPVLVLVADVDASGAAQDIDIEPDGVGTRCVHERLSAARLHPPPLAPGADHYPIGLRIDTR
jgi:hypothetical protein